MKASGELTEEHAQGTQCTKRPSLNEYRLIYRAGVDGIGKRVEFSAPDVAEAVRRAMHDAMGRVVEVWENGVFVHTVNPGDAAPADGE